MGNSLENTGRHASKWRQTGIGIGVACFLFFVWPTPYEYTRKAPDIYRANRFTGVTETATADGWRTDKQLAEAQEAEAAREAQEQAMLEKAKEQEHSELVLELSEFKDLPESNLGGSKANCSISWNGELRYKLSLTPSESLTNARSGAYSFRYQIDVVFIDPDDFTVASVEIKLDNLVGRVDETGKITLYNKTGTLPMDADTYKKIVSWSPTYNWGQ